MDHDLCDQRIVEGRNLCAGGDPVIDATITRQLHCGDQPGRGRKLCSGIFGIKADLNGMTGRWRFEGGKIHRVPGGLPHHLCDQVDTVDQFCNAVLDL